MHLYTQEENPLPEEIFSVSDINRLVKSTLEANFQNIWIKGEISNLSKPRSGHLYFTLKDESAQIRCAMFKSHQRKANFEIQEGLEVLVEGLLSLYTERGDYQLIATRINLWGEGQLQQAFDALKLKLQNLGWFDEARKKPIPTFPKHIGIVTSATGDALQDILRILRQRYPIAPVTLYSTLVQGKQSAPSIANAIIKANQQAQADVLIVARGGGSLEDLWGFNEEMVAKAIFESQIPIVTGIGHEMDFTISDFVADLRAPTPTGAAQFITPDQNDLLIHLKNLEKQLLSLMQRKIDVSLMQLDYIEKRLIHPKQKIQQHIDKCDHCIKQLKNALFLILQSSSNQIKTLQISLQHQNPAQKITQNLETVAIHKKQIEKQMSQLLFQKEEQMKQYFELLNALNPLNTLKRGFSVTLDENNRPVRSVDTLTVDSILQTRLLNGIVKSKILTITQS